MWSAAIGFLGKLPVIGGIVSWAKDKGRLILEYFLLAVVVVMAGLVLSLWITRAKVKIELAETKSQVTTLQNRLSLVETVNNAQEVTIGDLRIARQTDSEVLSSLIDKYGSLMKSDSSVRADLAELERSNEAVSNILDTPVPPELACLLDPRCKAGPAGDHQDRVSVPSRAASSEVRPGAGP